MSDLFGEHRPLPPEQRSRAPHPQWVRRHRHRLPVDEWIEQRKAAQAPIDAADHAEHMLHAQLLAEGMGARMRSVLSNRRLELLKALRLRAELPVATRLPYART